MWATQSEEKLLSTCVFEVIAKKQKADAGPEGTYYAIQGRRCVCIVAVYEGKLVMVRQYRHGTETITSEIPGGLIDEGETPEQAAARELEEESGFRAEEIVLLGKVNPNPALFQNGSELYVCLAVHPTPTGRVNYDADEVMHEILVPYEEVLNSFGTGEYTHSYLGTALLFYQRYLQCH